MSAHGPRKGESYSDYQVRRQAEDLYAIRDRPAPAPAPVEDKSLVKQLERQLAKLKADAAEREAMDAEIERRSSLKIEPLVIPIAPHEPGAPGTPMTMWSDWHWGEMVDRRETGNLNEFNREIAERRVKNLVNRTIVLLREYAGARPEYPGIFVFLGGDMVSGLIHDELVETNWGNIVTQASEVANAIAGALRALADEFGRVWVTCVPGNHGRTTVKPRAKGRALDSYDRAAYQVLADYFQGNGMAGMAGQDPRIHFDIPDCTDRLVVVEGHRFLLTHGDSLGVRGGDGIIGALGPIARGAVKLQRAESQVGQDFDTLVMGHWHQYMPRGDALPVIVNGTLKGYDEYARLYLRARFAKASQALWLTAPKHGVAAQWAVYLDD